MTRMEQACRWSIVMAYWEYQIVHQRSRLGVAAYARALGLNPIEVFP